MFIGRLPAKTTQELTDVVAKLVAYETFTPDQTWRDNTPAASAATEVVARENWSSLNSRILSRQVWSGVKVHRPPAWPRRR